MKSIKLLVLAALMSGSVAAMADGGGDIVAAHMAAARDHAIGHYAKEKHESAVASGQGTDKASDQSRSSHG